MPSKTPDGRSAERVAAAAGEGSVTGTGLLNLEWATSFTAALADSGVREAVIAPGSRSAPLALALDRSGLRVHVAIDERAGAYFALGLAKASRRPVAVLTTSGTAAANLHPAVLEAFHARVPLLLLTADRPPELRDTGAPQTVDQIRLFGTGVRWFAEAGVPTPGPEGTRYVASLGARAVATAWGPPSGPVHVNFPFREPLLPTPAETPAPGPVATRGEAETPEPTLPAPSAVARAARALRVRRRGLIVCGPEDGSPEFADAVARLAAVTGYPILADPLSGVRFGPHDRSRVIASYDLFLRSSRFAETNAPEAVVQFGPPLTSRAYHRYAEQHASAYGLSIDSGGAWRDPSRRAREVVAGDPAAACRALAEALERGAEPLPSWAETFLGADRAAATELRRHHEGTPALGEESVFPAVLAALPDGGVLYVGNSMAVRDLDLSAVSSAKRIRALGNRGVNGIDGVVSSALGASAAGDAPLLAVVGDLSFHHDLNALAALRERRARATIVVVQNDGGGIFSFLPVAHHGQVFERYFGTPHGLDLARAAALYGVPHAVCATAEELTARAAASVASRATTILEVRTDRAANVAAHEALAAAVRRAVEEPR
jgi:2-succinyl-5-enolpyruvyl-6-hydroxy-3-cyclohexene-1-carboxylate synthase